MVQRAIILKAAYVSMCHSTPALRQHQVSEDEWAYLENVCELLKFFDDVTTEISASQSYPTINKTIVVYNELLDSLDLFIDDANNDARLRTAAEQAREKLLKYYRKTDLSPVYAVASVMDPRMKYNWWSIQEWGEYERQSKMVVQETWTDDYDSALPEAEVTPKAAKQRQRYGIRARTDELDEYTKEAIISSDSEDAPTMYWKAQCKRWPNLSRMAQDYLAVPATSTPAERCFSSAKLVLPPQRNRLKPERIQQLILLNSWMQHLKSIHQ